MPDVNESHYLIVFNPLPSRKRKRLLQQLLNACRDKNIDFDLYPTDENYPVNAHFFRNNLTKYTDVVVLGGDGTFNLLVNFAVGTDIRVGLLSAGTGNDFSRTWYGAKKTNSELISTVLASEYDVISLGCCEFQNRESSCSREPRRYFHNILGIGFDAKLAKALRHNKGWFQGLGYFVSALRHIPFYQEQACHLTGLHDEVMKSPYQNLITVFANSCYFGNGLKIAPAADPKTSSLLIVGATKVPFWTKMALLARVLSGKHIGREGVFCSEQLTPVTIETKGLDIEADGEYLGQTPATVTIVPNALKLKR